MERPAARGATIQRRERGTLTSNADENPLECLSIAEVARLLRVTNRRVHNLIDQCELHAIRLSPRCVRIPRKSLEQFIQASQERERLRRLAGGEEIADL